MYPDRDTIEQLYPARVTTARDQSMVENSLKKAEKNTAGFILVSENDCTNIQEPQAKKRQFSTLSKKRNIN